MYTDGSKELANAIQNANDSYNQKLAELTTKGLQFENDAIMGAFPEISEAIKNSLNNINDIFGKDYLNGLAEGSIKFDESTAAIFSRELEGAFLNVAPETRKHIGEFYKQMMPSVEELKANMQGMEKNFLKHLPMFLCKQMQ